MMERIFLAVLLLLECLILVSCHLHQYHFVHESLTWTEAQTYCRQTYTDLATIEDEEEMKQLINTLSSAGYDADVWIGLYTEISWRWSDGLTGSGAEFRNWDTSLSEPTYYTDEFCVVSYNNGNWFDFNCMSPRPFTCYRGTQLDPEFVFMNEEKDWFEAQRYCRENHVDLVTVRNHEENQRMQNLVPSRDYAWIGLFRDPNIYWSDGSNFSFSNWDYYSNPIGSMRLMCGFTSLSRSGRWRFSSCENKSRFVCYSLPSAAVQQQVVKLRLKLKGSVDLNHPAVKADLQEKLQDRLKDNGGTGVTLKWREQPGGKVFHRDGKGKKTEL